MKILYPKKRRKKQIASSYVTKHEKIYRHYNNCPEIEYILYKKQNGVLNFNSRYRQCMEILHTWFPCNGCKKIGIGVVLKLEKNRLKGEMEATKVLIRY